MLEMTNTETMLAKVSSQDLSDWTEDKRDEFVNMFDKRAVASQYILNQTAAEIKQYATSRKFISSKHTSKLSAPTLDELPGETGYYRNTIGGRHRDELNKLAKDNARAILRGLPALSKVVEIIDPETSKMILEKEKGEAKGQKLTDQLVEVSEELDLDDLDQSMSLKEFRAMIKKRDAKRKDLINKLNDLGEELTELDIKITKRLYSGIPGLSDAIVGAVKSCYEKTKMLQQMRRRIAEQVKFGDSEAALEILRSFEKDEVELSDDVKGQFQAALKTLQLKGAKKTKKKVAKKKKKVAKKKASKKVK